MGRKFELAGVNPSVFPCTPSNRCGVAWRIRRLPNADAADLLKNYEVFVDGFSEDRLLNLPEAVANRKRGFVTTVTSARSVHR